MKKKKFTAIEEASVLTNLTLVGPYLALVIYCKTLIKKGEKV